ncbi:hypothetical protein [Niabella hirudinis]|uniref:hypothetical protein n=1 Tax=Niabella hirudinis TaxID=1285929 RepID=UPI003EC10596
MYIKKFIPFLLLLLLAVQADAQRRSKRKKKREPAPVVAVVETIPAYTPAMIRLKLHETIDADQKALLASDGKEDAVLKVSADEQTNAAAGDAVAKQVDWLQYRIETDPTMDQRLKANYLSGISEILRYVKTGWRRGEVDAAYLPQIIAAYKKCIEADRGRQSIAPVIRPLPYDVVYTAILPRVFKDNTGYKDTKDILLLKLSERYPQKTFAALRTNPESPHADSLIRVMAHKYPQQLYDYAQANNKLSYKIQNIEDDALIKSIVGMARSDNKSGQFYFPFLDLISSGKLTIGDIDAVKDNPVKYFRLLVKTQIEYSKRAAAGDTAIGYRSLLGKLEQKAKDEFVAPINGLHERPDAIRFRAIQPLTAEELYYVAVLTNGLIYTSSYTNGVYPLMMRKAGNKGDELLKNLNFDHYRKFISQAASYNTLKNFLSTFSDKEDTKKLMTSFVSNLEKTEGLEDGVDVADSYASVYETLPELAGQMLKDVKTNLARNRQTGNKKGEAIYNILNYLFLSADSSNRIDLTRELRIPPVYDISFNALANDKGTVISQVFFYGDQDGRNIFNGFLNMFNPANWKIDRSNKQWVVIKSTRGNPVSIYANRPLNELKGEDDKAQRALNAYLEEHDLFPTVTIHRGHSYYAPTTIDYMAPSSKLVFMGSCGGFNLIDSILRKSEDAHIIASKQIGKTAINKPFFLLLTEKLRTGKDIEWIPFWKEFKGRANVPGFEDYIPPYKNLGAIFIKAYKKETGETDI